MTLLGICLSVCLNLYIGFFITDFLGFEFFSSLAGESEEFEKDEYLASCLTFSIIYRWLILGTFLVGFLPHRILD